MTIYCPRCGQAGCDETVISFVSVWASCARCHLVWRSSLLETVVGYAARGVGLSKSQKIAARYNALHAAEELQRPSGSLKPVSVDRVAEWLASQERPTGAPRLAVAQHSAVEAEKVEEMFDMLDPVHKPGISAQRSDAAPVAVAAPLPATTQDDNDFYAFFAEVVEEPAPVPVVVQQTVVQQTMVEQTMVEQTMIEQTMVQQTVVDEIIEPLIEEPADDSVEEVAVESSEDPLASMENLYEAFKRLEQQLDTISDSLQTYNQHP